MVVDEYLPGCLTISASCLICNLYHLCVKKIIFILIMIQILFFPAITKLCNEVCILGTIYVLQNVSFACCKKLTVIYLCRNGKIYLRPPGTLILQGSSPPQQPIWVLMSETKTLTQITGHKKNQLKVTSVVAL